MSGLTLRPYQDDVTERTRDALRNHNAVLIAMATGLGKTALTVNMMAIAAARGKSSMFMVHRDTLLLQTSRALWKQKLEHGLIASGRAMSLMPVQVASVQTLVRRLGKVKAPDLIIVDEAHRAAADTYRKILEAYPNAKVVGLTATPQRTDGKGLGDVFETIVQGPDVAWGIDHGYLCKYVIYAPPNKIDMSSAKKRMGDFAADDVERIVDKPTVTGDAVSHYLKLANGKRCVVFCATLKHAQHVCDAYKASGVAAEYMDGNTPSNERQAILNRLASSETKVLVNVELVIEGIDVPAVEVVQWLRPTASLIIWMQGNGRGLRPDDGKQRLIILDHVGNAHRHGLPDDTREWSLDGQKKRGRGKSDDDVKIKQCAKCYSVFSPGPTHCPSCGEPLSGDGRKIEVVDGELAQVDIEAMRREQKREQGSARTLSDLVALGLRRGQKKPAEWAAIVAAARDGGRKPTKSEYDQAREFHDKLKSVWGAAHA